MNKSGVCMAIEHVQDPENPNNYTFKLHYPDKAIDRSVRHYAMGVPDQ